MVKMIIFILGVQSSFATPKFFDSHYELANVTRDDCPNLLSRRTGAGAVVRVILDPLLSREQLTARVRFYQTRARVIAAADTAFDAKEWNETRAKCSLSGHCGAMVWFLQRRFGGRAVLKKFATNGPEPKDFWHMYLDGVPYRTSKGDVAELSIDATKTQVDDVVDDLLPLGDSIRYRGQLYFHKTGMVQDRDYLWDQDFVAPPAPRLELFAERLEFHVLAVK